MNLILLTADQAARARVVLTDTQARHVRKVLRSEVGDVLRVGVIDGAPGQGTVRTLTPQVEIDCAFETRIPARSRDTLLLAVPRPIVLRRCLAHAAALGFGRILLFRSFHVDKNHLASRTLAPDLLETHLLDGLSQARRTRLPRIETHLRFRPFVEDVLPERLEPEGIHLVAHPFASEELADRWPPGHAVPCTLAIGPERGFTGFEVEALTAAGCQPVRTGGHPLRVETALAYATGQIHAKRGLWLG